MIQNMLQPPINPTTNPTSPPQPQVQPQRPQKTKWILLASLLILLIIGIFLAYKFFKRTQRITIPCPSVPEFCQNPKQVLNYKGGGAIGSNIKAGSPIFAVFNGQRVHAPNKLRVENEEYIQILLRNDQQKLTAVYYLKDTASGEVFLRDPNYKKGEIIATVSAEPIKYFGNYNLIFRLFDEYKLIPFEKIAFE